MPLAMVETSKHKTWSFDHAWRQNNLLSACMLSIEFSGWEPFLFSTSITSTLNIKVESNFICPWPCLELSCSMLENSKHGQGQNNISFQTTICKKKNSKRQGNGKEEKTYLKLLLKLCVFHLIKESKHIEYIWDDPFYEYFSLCLNVLAPSITPL